MIEQSLRPEFEKRPQRFDSMDAYVDFTTNEYNALLWGRIVPEINNHYARLYPAEAARRCTWIDGCGSSLSLRVSRTLLQLSKEAIASMPWQYAYHVAAHDYGLWRDTFRLGVDLADGINGRADQLPKSHDPRLNGNAVLLEPGHVFRDRGQRRKLISEDWWGRRAVHLFTFRDIAEALGETGPRNPLVLFAIGIAACALVPWISRISPAAKAFCYCGLTLNAYFLGTALAQPTLTRYAWTMHGLMAALLLLGIWLAWDALRDRIRAYWKRRTPNAA